MAGKHVVLDLTVEMESDSSASAQLMQCLDSGSHARRAGTRSSVTTPCTFASSKMGECFEAESPGEAEAMLLAEVLEQVVAFRPQAVEVCFFEGVERRRAFPDLCVGMLDGSVELWEVKGRSVSSALVRRLGRLSAALRKVGVRYRVLTPYTLGHGSRLANAGAIHRLAFVGLTSSVTMAIERAVPMLDVATLGGLQAATGLRRSEILAAAAKGKVAVDIGGDPVGAATRVRPALPGARSGGFVQEGI